MWELNIYMKYVKKTIKYLLLALLFLCVFSSLFAISNFGNITFDEILFHLRVPLKGTGSDMISRFIKESIVPTVVFLLVVGAIDITLNIKKIKYKLTYLEKKIHIKLNTVITLLICVSMSVLLVINLFVIGVPQYIRNNFITTQLFDNYYVKPENAHINAPEKKKNLIYILMESMESSYQSEDKGGYQKDNLIPELTKLSENNISFSTSDKLTGAYNMPGTGYTAAAMVAQWSGIPLKVPLDPNSYRNVNEYLPGAYSLGDFLKSEGYNQTFMCGSDITFGGRGDYLRTHGDYHIFDINFAKQKHFLPDDYFKWWGFEDDYLFLFAKEEVTRLAKEDKPFNFTVLTSDTHHVGGFVEPYCDNKYDKQYANVIDCSDGQIIKFVNWIKQQDFFKDTTIVLSGDHPSMDKDFFDDMPKDYERTVYNCIINSSVKPDKIKNRAFCTMDMYPTTLAAMGYKINGNRLGLGTDLFSDTPTVMETIGKSKLEKELQKKSTYFNDNILYKKKND